MCVAAVIAKYKGPDMEKPLIRPYTPVSDGKQRATIDFIIKKYPNGPMSSHMHDLQPGQRMEFRGPLPKYEWTPNKHEHIALIAGGTGHHTNVANSQLHLRESGRQDQSNSSIRKPN